MTIKFNSMQEMMDALQPQNAQPKKQQKKEQKESAQKFDAKRFILSWAIWVATMLIAAPLVTISYKLIVHAIRL